MSYPGWTWIDEPLTADNPRIAAELVADYLSVDWPVPIAVPESWLPEENWAQREKRFLDAALKPEAR